MVKISRFKYQNQLKIDVRWSKIALRSSLGKFFCEKKRATSSQERPRAAKERLGAKSKTLVDREKTPHIGGYGGLAEAGGGVREASSPSSEGVREYEAVIRTLRSLRKRRVLRIELASRDRRTLVGIRRSRRGAAGSFRIDFCKLLSEFRRFSSPDGAEVPVKIYPAGEVWGICDKKRRQERTKNVQERPRSSQERPKGVQLPARRVPEEPQ